MLSEQDAATAKAFAQWKPDETVDQTIKCVRCNRYFDYRIYLIHKCTPVPKVELGYIPSV